MISVNHPHKFTFKNILTAAYLIETIFIFMHALQLLVLVHATSNIRFWTMRFIYTKSSFLLVYLKLLNALFVTKIMKQLSISFVTALLQKGYGMM